MAEHFWKRVGSLGPARFSSAHKALAAAGAAVAVLAAVAFTWGGGEPTPSAAPRATASPTASTASATPTPSPTVTRSASPTATKTPKPTPTKSASRSPKPTPVKPRAGAPMTLSVPSIDVSGPLRRTSAQGGVVNPPSGVLGWISGYGRVRPGEKGTAVVAGHVVAGKRADVFYNLEDIDRGDKITVYDSDGKPVVYTVTATRVATKEAVSRDKSVWGANSSVRRIALITCDDDDGYRADGHRVSNFVAIAEAR